jgi:hypothetical protein
MCRHGPLFGSDSRKIQGLRESLCDLRPILSTDGTAPLPSEKMTLSMASENSHEIEIVIANFYFSDSPSSQNFISKERWRGRELDGKHGKRSKQASYKTRRGHRLSFDYLGLVRSTHDSFSSAKTIFRRREVFRVIEACSCNIDFIRATAVLVSERRPTVFAKCAPGSCFCPVSVGTSFFISKLRRIHSNPRYSLCSNSSSAVFAVAVCPGNGFCD